jgi:hypothetical protein
MQGRRRSWRDAHWNKSALAMGETQLWAANAEASVAVLESRRPSVT